MRVTYQRFGGLSPALTNRAKPYQAELTPVQEAQFRPLIPAGFFSLASSGPPRREPGAFRYEIAVEDGPRSHRVTLSESDVPDSLRPLLEWLQAASGG